MRSFEYYPGGSDRRVEAEEVIAMSEFKPIMTQAELDEIVKARIKRERKKILKMLLKLASVLMDMISELKDD